MDIRTAGRMGILLFADVASTYIAYWLASLLTNVYDEVFVNTEIFFILGILALINVGVLAGFRLYNNLWEYAGIDELLQIVLSMFVSTLLGAVFLWLADVRLPIRVFVGSGILLVLFVGGVRMLWRIVKSKKRQLRRASGESPRTLIVGAGETGALTIGRMLSKDPNMPGVPVAATDDDPLKKNKRIHGVKVVGTTDDIPELVKRYDVGQIVVAIPSASAAERKKIYSICTSTECTLRTLPNIRDIDIEDLGVVAFRDVDVTDLLGRDEIVLDTRTAATYVTGNTMLVTGGGGSIGSELCRQLAKVGPARVVVFDIYENDAYMLRNELLAEHPGLDVAVEIGSVCDEARVEEVFARYAPSAVFHAAAHKHVPLMEACPREAISNNVFGTLNVVRAADEHGVARFIFISTDKAVNPTSVMGATKRMGEMIMQYYARTSKTVFTAVRFGNVLGSNGSVIPLFKRQIAQGGPVTVTHPDIERYFMTIPEATRLVIQAGGMARGGEIFILDMGEPVKILDLARNLIRLSGLKLGEDIEIEFTGLRDGEKMYEELLMDEENTLPTGSSSIMVSVGQGISYDEVAAKLEELRAVIAATDEEAIRVLESAVPTYHFTRG
ncbi:MULTISPECIES: nucleoside-diphosphate sugar epimerase/dehydratase [unclassified Adlercreutzia]|uniref:polysaccharide biosynthesis protein n=1 Tax=unclassified Adlercreutzia TaxID=2636013 RepID=UPI0013EDA1AE|nr:MULTISPECIES: nucleoside-diphosphate sugar epimerase/dehydratase [unclassified Adlercreutzia]